MEVFPAVNTLLDHHSTIKLRASRGALNSVPIMPRDASLSDSQGKFIKYSFSINKLINTYLLSFQFSKYSFHFPGNHNTRNTFPVTTIPGILSR